MTRKLALVMVMMFALAFAAPVAAQDTMDKVKDAGGKIEDTLKDIGDIIDAGKTIVDEINIIGDVADPQMNPQYVALKKREIQRAYEDYVDAKQRYDDSWFFNRSSRKRAMEEARNEYLDKVEAFSKSKVDFDYDVYVNTDGYMIWRKPARKQKWQNSLNQHCEFKLGRADDDYKRKRREYEDEWWIFFWSKMKKKKAMEQAKENYKDTVEEVENMWLEAGLLTGGGLLTNEIIPEVLPGEEVEKIDVDAGGDM